MVYWIKRIKTYSRIKIFWADILFNPLPGCGFGGPGGGFRTGRSSGKPLLLPVLKKPPPGPPKPGRAENSPPPVSGGVL